ncbi:Uncharacterized protein dnl_39020 [Desulfonema limicola]|uniref:Uncharacterized protein n=1 Tax=Desulfonema limicola TaxID=45656 RepID=A0A975BAA2_9BACT|nr:Uncharacterized protein dnl_39020 [Desulfonema limicola]
MSMLKYCICNSFMIKKIIAGLFKFSDSLFFFKRRKKCQ